MRIELGKLQKDLQGTMVYVTHDQVEAMTLGHRIVVLNGGVVEQVGSPLELYHRPRNLFVAGFIGSPRMNLLAATLTAIDRHGARVRLAGGQGLTLPLAADRLHSGAAVTLGVRPEHLSEAGAGDVQLAGEVLVTERLGGETYLYVRLEDRQEITVKAAGDTATGTGDRVRIGVRAADCHLFDGDGAALDRTAPLSSG